MADMTTLTTRNIDTQAAGVDAFLRDVDSPSAAMLKIQEAESEEARTEILFNYTDVVEESKEDGTWSTKLNKFVQRAKTPCGDGFDTHCGDWRIEIKRENKDEGRDVEENEVNESDEKPTKREAAEEVKDVSNVNYNVTDLDDGIRVVGMDAPSKEESETEPAEVETKEALAANAAEESLIDRISVRVQNFCTSISSVTSPAMSSLRNMTTDINPTEQDDDAEVIKVSNLTEMALNGDQEDAYIAKEVIGHIKQVEHEKQFSIVEDAKKLMPHLKNTMDQIVTQAKNTWSFLAQKIGVAKTIQTETPTANDEELQEETAVIPDDITTPGLVNDVSSLQESTA